MYPDKGSSITIDETLHSWSDGSLISDLLSSTFKTRPVLISQKKNIGRNPIVDCERNGEIEKNRKK